ncbi:MAG: NUDIX hydrolase [Nesterenkonia sp.]
MTELIPQAATVLLLRPGTEGPAPEVLTITRADSLVFSAGVSAFPGGRVDAADSLPEQLWEGVSLPAWGEQLDLDAEAAGRLLACVIRETFEETGILLACDDAGAPVDHQLLNSLPGDARQRIEEHDLDFGGFLKERRLRPDVQTLRPLSRWITPAGHPRRYDTYFFLAAMPQHQEVGELSFEGAASRWTTAQEALTDFRTGAHQLMPPTWAQFRSLSAVGSVDEALTSASLRGPTTPRVADGSFGTVADFDGHEVFARDHAEWMAARDTGDYGGW